MAQEAFHLSIVLPTKRVFEGEVTEAIVPAFDGETGILAKHENFVGILGAGPLKYVHKGKDFWLAVSSGIFKVINGELSVVAEYAVKGEDIKEIESSPARIKVLEEEIAKSSQLAAKSAEIELFRERAKLEVYRRTNLLN